MQLSVHEVQLLTKDPVSEAIARSKDKDGKLIGNEFCNSCGCDMGFSILTHIEHPDRFKGGAHYRDGAGQTCGACEKELPAH